MFKSGKPTISMVIFHSYVRHYQRVQQGLNTQSSLGVRSPRFPQISNAGGSAEGGEGPSSGRAAGLYISMTQQKHIE